MQLACPSSKKIGLKFNLREAYKIYLKAEFWGIKAQIAQIERNNDFYGHLGDSASSSTFRFKSPPNYQ